MSPSTANSRLRQQHELDEEQMLVDLDQSIAEREQVRADRDQQNLDEAQLLLDSDISPAEDDVAGMADASRRQVELGLAQDRSDAHQTQLDESQRAQDLRRIVLDEQQAPLDRPVNPNDAIDYAFGGAAKQRDHALHRRALAAVARAEQAHRRAVEALHRVEAYERRQAGPVAADHQTDRSPRSPGTLAEGDGRVDQVLPTGGSPRVVASASAESVPATARP